jgi:branched-chain amino acid transport system ATP-binding protein
MYVHSGCMNLGTQVTSEAPASEPAPRLSVVDVSVRFGGLTALDGVSFDVPAGAVVGVIGPNGAGKTTLFNVVCGFTRPQQGSLRLDGVPLRPSPHRLTRRGIARTLQGLGLFERMTVLDNVLTGADQNARAGFVSGLLGLPRADRDDVRARTAAMALLEELGLADLSHALPSTLSYAHAKRVSLARALISEPRLLLLDEPAGGLGGEDIAELVALVTELPKRWNGCSVVLVEHHVDMVMQVCDSVVVLDFGKVIASGTPAEVAADDGVTEAYLGAEVSAR